MKGISDLKFEISDWVEVETGVHDPTSISVLAGERV